MLMARMRQGTYTPQRLDLAVLLVRLGPGRSTLLADSLLQLGYFERLQHG